MKKLKNFSVGLLVAYAAIGLCIESMWMVGWYYLKFIMVILPALGLLGFFAPWIFNKCGIKIVKENETKEPTALQEQATADPILQKKKVIQEKAKLAEAALDAGNTELAKQYLQQMERIKNEIAEEAAKKAAEEAAKKKAAEEAAKKAAEEAAKKKAAEEAAKKKAAEEAAKKKAAEEAAKKAAEEAAKKKAAEEAKKKAEIENLRKLIAAAEEET